jgi:head-tail adaptor
MLSPSDIARARRPFVDWLPGTAVIQRATNTSDGQGGQTQTWSPVATVRCRLSPLKGGEPATTGRSSANLGDRAVDERTYVLTFAAKTDIGMADRAVVDDTTYEVTNVRTRGELELSRRVDVKELP